MEDGLVPWRGLRVSTNKVVLILVVMEDGLVHGTQTAQNTFFGGLNPCCNGRWSRTRRYI